MSNNKVCVSVIDALASTQNKVERQARDCLKASQYLFCSSAVLMTCGVIMRKRLAGEYLLFFSFFMFLLTCLCRDIFSARLSAQQSSQAFTDDVLETIASL